MLSNVPSASRFLVDVFSFVVHAEFEVGVLTPEEVPERYLGMLRGADQDGDGALNSEEVSAAMERAQRRDRRGRGRGERNRGE